MVKVKCVSKMLEKYGFQYGHIYDLVSITNINKSFEVVNNIEENISDLAPEAFEIIVEEQPKFEVTANLDAMNTWRPSYKVDESAKFAGLEKYLTEEQKQQIVTKIFEEKIGKEVDRIIEARYAGKIADEIFYKLTAIYVNKIDSEYEQLIQSLVYKELNASLAGKTDPDGNLCSYIRYQLQSVIGRVLETMQPELNTIFKEKVLASANEMLLNAFLSQIVRKLDFDTKIKNILQEQAENLNDNENN